jgi:purine nucleoside phosphorylase
MFTPPVLTEEEKIAKHYEAMGHSVTLINNFRAGNHPDDMEAEQVNHMIDQNVRHLEIMVAKDFWTDEDMTAINAAIEG